MEQHYNDEATEVDQYISFSGGAIRGYALLGVCASMAARHERELEHAANIHGEDAGQDVLKRTQTRTPWKGCGGVSIGALVAYLCVHSPTTDQWEELMQAFRHLYPRQLFGFTTGLISLQGIVKGIRQKSLVRRQVVLDFITGMCRVVGIRTDGTLGDVYRRTGRHLSIATFDFRALCTRRFTTWGDPETSVLPILCASMSVQGVIEPTRYNDTFLMDGGAFANAKFHFGTLAPEAIEVLYVLSPDLVQAVAPLEAYVNTTPTTMTMTTTTTAAPIPSADTLETDGGVDDNKSAEGTSRRSIKPWDEVKLVDLGRELFHSLQDLECRYDPLAMHTRNTIQDGNRRLYDDGAVLVTQVPRIMAAVGVVPSVDFLCVSSSLTQLEWNAMVLHGMWSETYVNRILMSLHTTECVANADKSSNSSNINSSSCCSNTQERVESGTKSGTKSVY